MSDRELRINVYDSSKVGHANVSFYRDGQHQYTIGANIRLEVPQLALPRVLPFEPDDGIYRDESAFHLSAIVEGTIKSAGVPTSETQYDALLDVARSLENETFNYSVFTEACIELVENFYEATGHPGEFGDLFAAEDRAGSLVWSRVPVSDDNPLSTWPDDQPLYSPPDPFMPDPPTLPIPTVFGGMPDPPVFSNQGISSDITILENDPVDDDVTGGMEEQTEGEDLGVLDDRDAMDIDLTHELVLGDFRSHELHFDETPQPISPLSNIYGDADPSNGCETAASSGHSILTTLPSSGPGETVLSFSDSVTNTLETGHAEETWSLATSARISSDSSLDRSYEPPAASPSPFLDFGTTFDTGADSFDFRPTEPDTDLGFGQEYDGSDLMDALSIPAEELGYSFDSQSGSLDEDHTEYNHGYDEFGII